MTDTPTRRTILRRIAAAGSGLAVPGIAAGETDAGTPRRAFAYTCDVTTSGPDPNVDDVLLLVRVRGTFGPTKPDCFGERETLYRYLFVRYRAGRTRRSILWATERDLPDGLYRITNVSVCVPAPSGYCGFEPFYRVLLERLPDGGFGESW
ncbi:hypothetical protein [Halomicrococcus sp. NG-SE-24]|uniref:hypothetical protein n=1 Tax=Halomicrococcus sp. NG-SE-24 TaxID=3436928 RepID=UPI003D992685